MVRPANQSVPDRDKTDRGSFKTWGMGSGYLNRHGGEKKLDSPISDTGQA